MSDSFDFARIHLEEYATTDPLGLQRVVANVMFESTTRPTDYAIVESIVLALISCDPSLKLAAEQGINRSSKATFNEINARLSAVNSVLNRSSASELLTILHEHKVSLVPYNRFSLNTAYHFVYAVVSADPVIRREAKKLL